MPDDRTMPYGEPLPPERTRRPDRIVEYARRGARELIIVIAATIAFGVLLQVLFYEVLGSRNTLTETVLRGAAVAFVPVFLILILVRQKR